MSLQWWRSMLPQGLREILLCTLTHAHKAAVNYLPLSLVNTRFICVPYSALGAFVKGFTRFCCLLGGHRIPRPGGRSVLSRCSDSVGSVGISHAVCLLPDSDLNCLGVFFFYYYFLNFVNDVSIWLWASLPLVGALHTLGCEGVSGATLT